MIDNFSRVLALMREAFDLITAGKPAPTRYEEPRWAGTARRCEADHVLPYSRGGRTTPQNLTSLCKHHHRLKHQAGWTLTMTRDGT